jgi:predicted PurR-regulated permease PerM
VEIRNISAGATLRVAALVLLVIVAARFLWIAHAIFIVTFLGVLLGLAMARAVDYLERIHIKRGLGAPLVLLVGLGLVIGLFALIGPSIAEQARELGRELPKAMEPVERWVSQSPARALLQQPSQQPQQQQGEQQQGQQQEGQQQQKPQEPQKPQKPEQQQAGKPQDPQKKDQQQQGGLSAQLGKELRGATKFLFPIVSSIFGAIGGLVIVLFIAMYVAAQPGLYRAGLLHLVPHHNRGRAEELLDALSKTLRQWLLARLMAMVIIGTLTGGALALLGIKGAAALGVLAGVLEFVPFFGPIVSAIPAIGIALVDSPQKALYVVILYLVMQQLEGNVVTPLLLEKRLDIPPVMTVVAVAALGMVFGVIGMLIAEPLLAAVLVTTKLLYVKDVVGDDVKIGKKE